MATRRPRGAARPSSKARGSKKTTARARTAPRAGGAKAPARAAKGTWSVTQERRHRTPETLRLRSIEPSITVNDLEQSLRFYTDVLGFIAGERWEEGGVLRGVKLKAGVCELGLSQDDFAKGRDRKKGEGVRIWCKTGQDIDAVAARIKAAGGRLTQEPSTEMGARSLSVDDLDGYHLSIFAEI